MLNRLVLLKEPMNGQELCSVTARVLQYLPPQLMPDAAISCVVNRQLLQGLVGGCMLVGRL